MTPFKLLTSVFYDHLSFKSPWNNLVKYEIKNKNVIITIGVTNCRNEQVAVAQLVVTPAEARPLEGQS